MEDQEEQLGTRAGHQPAWDEFRQEQIPEETSEQVCQHPALRAYSAFRSILLSLGALLGAACILVFAVSLLFGLRPLIVVSGSMEPTIPVGSVVLSQQVPAGEVEDGSIVTVERPRGLGLVTHRLVKSAQPTPGVYEYTLRGDANTQNDPEPYKVTTAGKYIWHIVGLGYLAASLQSSYGMFIAAAAGLALLALFILDPARLAHGSVARARRRER
ncbi:signal peptidase I [Arthrobacter sp. NPDC080073]|uniref:signal peptidase I n=1 Tax=Arthrobacter sp. NPDC080073 TaxID=3155919 RepID=UPI003432ED98